MGLRMVLGFREEFQLQSSSVKRLFRTWFGNRMYLYIYFSEYMSSERDSPESSIVDVRNPLVLELHEKNKITIFGSTEIGTSLHR